MEKNIVYLDLFSGLGSFAKGFLNAGFTFRKQYFSEIEPHCIASYRYNFKNAIYAGDINQFHNQKIETPDLVSFGSPCQDLSVAGRKKGLKGSKSNLFFKAIEILDKYRPRVFVFENVIGLLSSNQGKDFEIVLKTIAGLGVYDCQWQLINSAWFLPQNRERVYLVGFRRDQPRQTVFPLHLPYEKQKTRVPKINHVGYAAPSISQVNRIFKDSGTSPALMAANGFGVGYLETGTRIRRLTPIEGERLQGLPDNWTQYGMYGSQKKPIPLIERYTMIGNAVTATVVTQIGKALLGKVGLNLNGTPQNLTALEQESEALLLQFLLNQSSKK